MAAESVIKSLGLLVALQLAAAVRLSRNQGDAGVSCAKESSLFGMIETEKCTCEGREFGPGHTGDFVHDDRTDQAPVQFAALGKNKTFWDFNAYQNGKEVSLSQFKSKLALVVNVASAWGFSNAFYTSAADLLNKYAAKGFTLIAVPANQHGAQAPHSSNCEREILYYKMGMSDFPVLDKVEVNGPKAIGFYKFLKAKKSNAEGGVFAVLPKVAQGELSWNYEKFLVNENGEVIGRYTHLVDAKDLEPQIRAGLGL